MNQSSKKALKPAQKASNNKNRSLKKRSYRTKNRNPIQKAPLPSNNSEIGDGVLSSVPTAFSRNMRTGSPMMITQRNGDCRIVHREYVQDVVASTGSPSIFSNTTLPINPGQIAAFPWLSGVAIRFESYRFNRLKFDYETEAPSSLGGTLVLAVDYDASDSAALTKQAAMAWRGSVRSAPWRPCCHTSAIEDLNKQKSYFVRPGLLPVSADVKTYDVGNLNIISQNVTTASSTLGELYVDYDILLMTPVYEQSSSTSGSITMTAPTIAAPFLNGISLGSIQLSTLAATPTVLNVNGLVIGQEYLVLYAGNSGSASNVTWSTPVGWTLKTALSNGLTWGAVETYTATSTSASITMTLNAPMGVGVLCSVSQIPISAL
jgi:hypothetical protein